MKAIAISVLLLFAIAFKSVKERKRATTIAVAIDGRAKTIERAIEKIVGRSKTIERAIEKRSHKQRSKTETTN